MGFSKKKRAITVSFLFVFFFLSSIGIKADNETNSSLNVSYNLLVNITETGKIIRYYDQYYITRVTGQINFTNPSNRSQLYKLSIPFVIPSGMMIVDTGTNILKGNELVLDSVPPSSFINTTYKIVGISTENPMRGNNSILMTAITSRGDIKAYADLRWKLTKSDPSDQLVPGILSRLVVAEIYNPTDFSFRLEFLKIIKTESMDPNEILQTWNFASLENNSIIPANFIYRADAIDTNLTDQDIYWVNLNLYLSGVVINSTQFNLLLTQENLTNLGEPTEIIDGEITNATFLEENLFIRKFITKGIVNPGDELNVTILINNLDPFNRRILVYDKIPLGFEIVDKGDAKELQNRTLFWNTTINPDSIITLTYSLKFVDETSVGIDYFEATTMIFENKSFYSRTIPYIRRYVPDSKAYIQKKLKYSSTEEVIVTIDIKNLGEDNLQNIILKEYLDKTDTFREITKLPQGKGVWSISSIKPGETWTVSYITDENERNLILPIIFGISQGSVLQTLIMDTVVKYNFFLSSINYIEYVGIAALVTVPLLILVLRKRKQIGYAAELHKLDKQIKGLLESTHVDYIDNLPEVEKSKIDKLQKDIDELKAVTPEKLSDEQKNKVAKWLKSNQDYIDKLMKETKR